MPRPTTADRPSFVDGFLELISEPFINLFLWRNVGAAGFFALTIAVIAASYQIPYAEPLGANPIPYVIVGVVGAVAGVIGGRLRVLALVAGAIAALGSLFTLDLLFHNVKPDKIGRVWIFGITGAFLGGLLPGVILYGIGEWFLTTPEEKSAKASARLERRRREHGLPPSA